MYVLHGFDEQSIKKNQIKRQTPESFLRGLYFFDQA
jgi:hypothetical protein